MRSLTLFLVLICPNILMAQVFTYPVPPDSIRDRQGRVSYMAEHFWNEQSISDTACFQSPKLLLDYLYLLKQSEEREADKCIHSFVSLSCNKESTFGLILYWLDNILYESSSSHYDEGLYLKLLNEVITSDADSVMKLIPQQRVDIMCKNKIGEAAGNFSFIDKAGKRCDLYSVETPFLLLVFNNPDCSLCHQTEEQIAQNVVLQNMLNNGRMKVLGITPDADYKDWMEHEYPSNWLTGYDKEKAIYTQRLYDIQHLPCIYLLDKEKRVLLKEGNYERLCNYLSENYTLFKNY